MIRIRRRALAPRVAGRLLLLGPCLGSAAVAGDAATPVAATRPDQDRAPAPPPIAPGPAPEPIPAAPGPTLPPQAQYPLDLSVALRLAAGENPDIARAGTEILGALALQQQARALLLPTLNAGTNYHGHAGNLQRSSGRILNLSEQSLYVGGGARTLAAESIGIPAVNIVSPLTEAYFEPLAARRRVDRARFATAATFNRVLRDVAVLYLELIGAQARVEALRLNAEQAAEVARVTASFASSGEGRPADADRARGDLQLRQAEIQRAEGDVAAASARLAQQLNLDPTVKLVADSGPLAPICLVDPASDPAELTAIALRRRPELAARAAEIAEALVLVKEEIFRPLLPTLWIGFSGGGFGGGSNLSPPDLGRFAGRTDFDVRLYWTLLNFGAGNSARIKQRKAQVGRAEAERAAAVNRVRREVVEALAVSGARARQIDDARTQLAIAERGFAEDLSRARQALGRPLEVLDNLELLAQARLNLIRAIVQYDQAQFGLFVALGSPPPVGPTPAAIPPPPNSTPLHAPIRVPTNDDDVIRPLRDMRGIR